MKTGEEIEDEKNPFLREIWQLGYDKVEEYSIDNEIRLIKTKDKFIKRIPSNFFIVNYFKIMKVRLLSGEIHEFISASDGSLQRFIDLVKP